MDLTREQVLQRDISWETLMASDLMTPAHLQLMRRYDHQPEGVQIGLLEQDGVEYVAMFLAVLHDIAKEDVVEYVLAVLDQMLSANPMKHARLFHDQHFKTEDVYRCFLSLLARKHWFMQEKSCKILTILISARPKEAAASVEDTKQKRPSVLQEVLQKLVGWLCGQLRHPSHPSRAIPTAVSSLATLLKDQYARNTFVRMEGVKLLAPMISPATTQQYIQLLYEATLCMWLLSYHDVAVEAIAAAHTLPRLVEVARSSAKEKVVRVALLTMRNLMSKRSTFVGELVELGMAKVIQSLKLQAWSDEDLVETLSFMEAALQRNIELLSSFDKYKQEVLSGSLDWTPVHKDLIFWKENVKKFEEADFQVLRVLVTILDNSQDQRTQAVACHDIAQFIKHHPAGRGIVLDMRAKDRVMRLMGHDSAEVRKEALLCVQKLMLGAKYASYMHQAQSTEVT